MNKKGFTLIELLAVVVILGVVLTIGSVSVATVRRKIDKKMFENKLEFVIQAGKNWGNDNRAEVVKNGNVNEKTIAELITNGALETKETKAKDNSYTCVKEVKIEDKDYCSVVTSNMDDSVINDLKVRIQLKNNRIYACIPATDNSDNLTILGDDDCTRACDAEGKNCTWNKCEYSTFYCV